MNRSAEIVRGWAGRLTLALCVVAGVNLTAVAFAHPSDYSTLTLDFLFRTQGLEAIDAAVVESEEGSYEPFPSEEMRHEVAIRTLQALGTPREAVHIDASDSPLYHEVGFLIRFEDPSHGVSRNLRIETAALRDIASDLGLNRLKVSVCGVGNSLTSPDKEVLTDLQIRATHDGMNPRGLDREACTVWALTASDGPVEIEVGSFELPETGTPDLLSLVGATSFILLGFGVILLSRTRGWNTESDV